jgi:hypothetical protein
VTSRSRSASSPSSPAPVTAAAPGFDGAQILGDALGGDLPADFGPWQTVWKRHHRWSLDGSYDEMFAELAVAFGFPAELIDDIEKLLSADSTSVRAHQHAAGARSDTLSTGGTVELPESRRRAR